jgi:hypothetical protein
VTWHSASKKSVGVVKSPCSSGTLWASRRIIEFQQIFVLQMPVHAPRRETAFPNWAVRGRCSGGMPSDGFQNGVKQLRVPL